MALNIANKEVEKKAILASRILGVNKTAAVEKALDYYLEHCGVQQDKKRMHHEISLLFDELSELPVLDNRSPEEILAYDKNGLP